MLVLKTTVLLLALAAVSLESGYAQSVRMSYTGTPGFTTPFWLTYEAGLLKKQGLRGEIIMVSGGALNLQALIAGEVDFVNAAGPALINAVLKGADLTIIASAFNFLPYGLVVGKDIPQRVEDVLNPKWKGKIASTPYAASFDRLSMIWGEEKTTAFLEKFVKQVTGLIRCGEDDRIAAGEFAMLVFNCDLAAPQEAKEKGGPVDGQVFRDAGILSYWYVTVPSNARNSNAATLLAAFLLSKDGQDILYNTERSSSHLVKGTPMQKFVAEQEKRGVKFTAYSVSDVVKNAEEHSRIRQKFQKILAGN
jgi:ABC-type Fe3+ transport system substrate-binding protein